MVLSLVVQGDAIQAKAVLQRAVAAAPKFAAAHANLGNAHRAAGDFDRARDEYRLATELASDRPEGWFNLGILNVDEQTDPQLLHEAIVALKNVDATGPTNAVAREYIRIAERRLAPH